MVESSKLLQLTLGTGRYPVLFLRLYPFLFSVGAWEAWELDMLLQVGLLYGRGARRYLDIEHATLCVRPHVCTEECCHVAGSLCIKVRIHTSRIDPGQGKVFGSLAKLRCDARRSKVFGNYGFDLSGVFGAVLGLVYVNHARLFTLHRFLRPL